ncbi:MAG: TonB-dependent receptor, partial [Thermoanaerobaculia bacterium]
MRRNPRFKSLFLFLVLVVCAGAAMAQVVPTGTLGGQVKDETGAALPGASVTASSVERGYARSTVTDTAGRFRFAQVTTGMYKVTVSLSGFATVSITNNLVENEKKTELAVALKLSAQQAEVTITGEVPIIDKTNAALETRRRGKEFEKMPVGRSYQSLFLSAPGVNLAPGANPNPSVHGALSGNNQYLYDGIDTTDPTTGTFGGNLNFEAIQEVSVLTSGMSAEYGRLTGGLINVITKSGTNTFAGSFKMVMDNDRWNDQNKTVNQVTGASLARPYFDHRNQRYAGTLGGPFWQDHIWFFGAYETSDITGANQSTPVTNENYQQTTHNKFWDAKLTAQITPSIAFNSRGSSSPTSGFVVNYGNPGELRAYTQQDQTSQTYAGFLTGVFGPNLTAEGQYNWNGPSNSAANHYIDVRPFSAYAGAPPHFSLANGFYFNGAFFDGYVNRPRQGALGAVTYFADLGGNSHSFKAGVDYQHLVSTNRFGFPGNQLFIDNSFNTVTRAFSPNTRRDYDAPVSSISDGKIWAFYARDKFEIGKHVFMELGLRYEHQSSNDDILRTTVNAGTVSPRASISYDISGTGKSLVVGSYGRFYQFVLQTFSDGFGQNAQQANYNNYVWNGTAFVFEGRVLGSGSAAQIPSSLKPTFVDEGALGYRQQIGNTIGVQVTGIYRKWGNIIDDVPIFDLARNQTVTYTNLSYGARKFYGAELTLDKRFSDHWNANASYAWGKTTSNTDSNTASSLADYLNSNGRTTVDPTVGAGGVVPCSTAVQGPNRTGQPTLSIAHSVKAGAAYVHSLGPVNLALGLGGSVFTGVRYAKARTLNVLYPGTTTNAGPTTTWFYEPRGSRATPTIY